MARDLFSDVSAPSVRLRSSSRWTIPISIAGHAVIVALVVIIPLMAADVLPSPNAGGLDFVAAAVTPPDPPAPVPPTRVPERPAPDFNPDAAPIVPPDKIVDEVIPTPSNVATGGLEIGGTHGVPIGDGFGIGIGTPVPARPDPPPPTPNKPVRAGLGIREPVKVRNVAPIYPAIAQAARISGTVIIDAIIGTDGIVRDARVLSGVPLLNQAALDAVRQWRYTPTTLNGVPVQVVMTVRVDFQMK